MAVTEFDDTVHYGIFTTSPTLTSQSGKYARQSEVVLSALRAQGVFDTLVDSTTAPTTDRLWLDKNTDPAVLKEYDPIGASWQPMTFDRLFGRAVVTNLTNVGGTADAITVDEPTSFISERLYALTPSANNTGAATLQVTGVGTYDITYHDGTDIDANELVSGDNKVLLFTSGRFEVVTPFAPVYSAQLAAEAAQAAAESAAALVIQRFVRTRVIDTSGGNPSSDYEAGDVVDGVTLVAGDIVLRATDGGNASDGVYAVPASGAASRSAKFDEYDDHPGSYFSVMEGTVNADTLWRCTSDTGGTLESTSIVIEQFSGGDIEVAASKADLRAVDTSVYTTAVFDGDFWKWDASDLSSTLRKKTEAVTSVSGNVCTSADHDLYDGEAVMVTSTVNGITANTLYYAIRLSKDTFSVATSFANARAGTAHTLTGTVTFTLYRLKDAAQAVYVIKSGDSIDGSNGAWVRQYAILTDRMFGTVYDASTDDTEALQMAIDFGEPFWLLDGRHLITDTLYFDDKTEIRCESDNATIRYATAASMDIFAGRKAGGGATAGNGERNFNFRIHGGLIEGTGYGDAFNFLSTSDARVYGTRAYLLDGFAKNGGSGSTGAFYNEFYDCQITAMAVFGYRNGTLGNEVKVYGGRITDTQIGTDDDNNSRALYIGLAIETFTLAGHRISNTGSAATFVTSIGGRFENPNTSSPYNSAVAFDVKSAAQDAQLIAPQIIQVATPVNASGTRTNINRTWQFVVNKGLASLAAGAVRQEFFSVPSVSDGDHVSVTLPSSWPSGLIATPPIISTGRVYLQLYNPTAGAISLAADVFVFNIIDRT